MTRRKNKLQKVLFRVLAFLIAVIFLNLVLSGIADLSAYHEPIPVDQAEWEAINNKIRNSNALSEAEYQTVFSQTGLGKPALDKLIKSGRYEEIEKYYDYYMQDKDFECYRDGFVAYHEYITDKDGNKIENPRFADLQNGDIIITLSIHTFGWRHGHVAIVTDAYNGKTVQAVMMGEKSAFGNISEWRDFPLVAVLRAKDTDAETRQEIAEYAKNNLVGLEYSLFAGLFGEYEEPLTATQCAHLVWYAYNQYGIDIDSNGGAIVTPKEILKSDKLEIVQVYGNIDKL